MKQLLLIFIFTLIFWSCKTNTATQQVDHDTKIMNSPKSTQNWKVLGTEPFWNIEIHGDTALYTRLNEKIDSLYLTIHHYSDQDSVVQFHLSGSGTEGEILLRKGNAPCSDGMSDNQYTYSATFHYGKETLKGCAEKIQ